MRIIHCADLHLDSVMTKHFDEETAAIRRRELLLDFERMVEYAKEHRVQAILIAGDLFDTDVVSRMTAETVRRMIASSEEIAFYYLRGNHDIHSVLREEPVPKNLHLFSKNPITYQQEDVYITGAEGITDSLQLPEDGCQIVMLHGMDGKDFSLAKLQNTGIDYLALGHLHTYQWGALSEHGVYCYPGCLSGRGFDECGEKGFVLLETKGRKVLHTFIPFARRRLWDVPVDVSKPEEDVVSQIKKATADIAKTDMVRVSLQGEVDSVGEWNLAYLQMRFAEHFFVFQIKDRTALRLDMEALKKDRTMRGEFLRLVQEQEMTDSKKKAIAQLGLRALMGENLE